jgi:hypothetical protein
MTAFRFSVAANPLQRREIGELCCRIIFFHNPTCDAEVPCTPNCTWEQSVRVSADGIGRGTCATSSCRRGSEIPNTVA